MESEQVKDKLQDANKSLYEQKNELLREVDVRYQQKMHQLENEIEDLKLNQTIEMQQIQEHSQTSLAQLKEFYLQEKTKLETRLTERQSVTMSNLQGENEQMWQAEQMALQQEIECLQD